MEYSYQNGITKYSQEGDSYLITLLVNEDNVSLLTFAAKELPPWAPPGYTVVSDADGHAMGVYTWYFEPEITPKSLSDVSTLFRVTEKHILRPGLLRAVSNIIANIFYKPTIVIIGVNSDGSEGNTKTQGI